MGWQKYFLGQPLPTNCLCICLGGVLFLQGVLSMMPKGLYNRFRKNKGRRFSSALNQSSANLLNFKRKLAEAEIDPARRRLSGKAITEAVKEIGLKGITPRAYFKLSPRHPLRHALGEVQAQFDYENTLGRDVNQAEKNVRELAQKRSDSKIKTAIRLAVAKPGTARRLIRAKWKRFKNREKK